MKELCDICNNFMMGFTVLKAGKQSITIILLPSEHKTCDTYF